MRNINLNQPFVFGKHFFAAHQEELLYFANSWIGRKILCLDGENSSVGSNKIIKIEPNSITWKNNKNQLISEFRTHDKFAKRIFHAFKPFWYLIHTWDTLLANNLEPAWNLGFDTLTAYPDANPETSTVDGRVYKTSVNDTWSNIVTGAGTGAEDSGTNANAPLTDSGTTSGRFDFISRGIFLFDTSSIPDTDTISSATFSNYVESKSTGIVVSVNVVSSSPASNTALVSGDYSNLGSTKFSTAIAVSGITTSQYTDWALNASGLAAISKTGITKLGTRMEQDIDNSAPTWSSDVLGGINVSFSERTGTSQDPKLVVVHAGSTIVKDVIGVGIIPFPR